MKESADLAEKRSLASYEFDVKKFAFSGNVTYKLVRRFPKLRCLDYM